MNYSKSELHRRLRAVFESAGYRRYKMSKFEEYDLYAENKDFLVSENVLTFTDLDGRLMALKPDVTLSIVKNCPKEGVEKLYYHENVYRAAGLSFKEIAQAGLECIGKIDEYCVCEVLALAAQSLRTISESYELAVSHLGLMRQALEAAGLNEPAKKEAFRLIGDKNSDGLGQLLKREQIDSDASEKLLKLSQLDLPAEDASGEIRKLLSELAPQDSIDLFCDTCELLGSEFSSAVRVDFSTVGDLRYYSGIFFKGYIDGVPSGVLSGGQYDGLMKKLKKSARAIGFALYLDALDPLFEDGQDFDADILLLYKDNVPAAEIFKAKKALSENGESVCAMSSRPDNMKFRKIYTVDGSVVRRVE